MGSIFYLLYVSLFTIASTKYTNKNFTVFDNKCPELSNICKNLKGADEFAILHCLYQLDPNIVSHFNEDCHQFIWNFINSIIKNEEVELGLTKDCGGDLQKLECPDDNTPGSYLKCIVTNKDTIKNPTCLNKIEEFENAAFYDYQWIGSFLQHCKSDIEKLSCGHIDLRGPSQAATIECLQEKIGKVKEECRKETFRLAEIQADNIKLDHQLYLACIEDQNKYCSEYSPGSGRIYKCLMQYRHEKLTNNCAMQLQRVQKLISQDYKVSRGFMKACREDIKTAHCRKQTSNDREIRLAQILVCLQNVVRNGTKIDPDCENEMDEHRKLLMNNYRLSPEILSGCSNEISFYCSGLEIGGKTIHCLMNRARWKYNSNRISPVCERALEDLVKETVAGDDWRVDPVLHQACDPVVRTICHDVRGGNGRVISCLMDNVGADHMTEACEDALMQIQYFVVRNFKLDPQLYQSCHDDAVRLCHVSPDWDNSINQAPENGPLVLPCLYRYMYHPEEEMQLKPACTDQIRRVMRQRAVSVELLPELEEACMSDLSVFCSDKTAKGEEMQCLQKNLAELQDKCKDAIINYTEVEAQSVDLNPFIVKYCKKAMETHCSTELKHDNGGEMMECLIAHKNDPDVKSNNKCRISIEHFQIISLKDYRFSYKFKMACKNYAVRYCYNAKTKSEVVACLSEKIRNDTINGLKSDVHKECRQQIKAQLFQQRENINFNPKLKEACQEDIKEHCKDVEHGSSQILECLQMNSPKLKDTCRREIFKIKKQELTDNSIDYALINTCESSIQQFCPNYEKEQILECLKKYKDEIGFNKDCRLVVIHRMIEQNSDYRLNPTLQENCKADINKFCQNTIIRVKPDQELNGEVIKCLKEAFKKSKLTNRCEKQMATILREQALNVQLNPLLKVVCKNELETICKHDDESDAGSTEECLKDALLQHKIPTAACQVEVANLIEESHADIQVDPLLQQTCSVDLLKYCREVVQGQGRHIKCLKHILTENPTQLEPDCRNMLTKRLEMYKNAVEIAPVEDLRSLYGQVVSSPSKHYFFLVGLMAIASFFVIGMFFGRVTKRQLQSKNK